MKREDYNNSRFKHQLLAKKHSGQSYVIWSLTPDQVCYVENVLGFYVEPYIFRITTKQMLSVKHLDSILKEVHYAKKGHKSRLFKKLSHKQQKLLNEYCVYFTPIKYKIFFKS